METPLAKRPNRDFSDFIEDTDEASGIAKVPHSRMVKPSQMSSNYH